MLAKEDLSHAIKAVEFQIPNTLSADFFKFWQNVSSFYCSNWIAISHYLELLALQIPTQL